MTLIKKVILIVVAVFGVIGAILNIFIWQGWPFIYANFLILVMCLVLIYFLNIEILGQIKMFTKKFISFVNTFYDGKMKADKKDLGYLVGLMEKIKQEKVRYAEYETSFDRAKNDFVALASHQLFTPLTIIKWHAEYILEDMGNLKLDQVKYVYEIYRNTEHLIELVNALLDVSRIDVGTFAIEPEPTRIINMAESALETFLLEIDRKKIKLIKDYDKDLPILNLDQRLTKVVFQNIIFNSVKYTEIGGYIKIGIKKRQKDVLIEISDTGCGIPRDVQSKIFTKFFRAENVKRTDSDGTGLGLYIVKAAVEKSGGKIWFESPLVSSTLTKEIKSKKIIQGTSMFISMPLYGMKKKSGTKKLTGGKE